MAALYGKVTARPVGFTVTGQIARTGRKKGRQEFPAGLC
jgi:hypothetical protein